MPQSKSTSPARRIAVVGGGASGALLAIAIADRLHADAGIGRHAPRVALTVFEPREQLGRGLAYSTRQPEHVLNVPAARVSVVASEPNDFVEWCRQSDVHALPHSFIERRRFGEYVTQRLWERVSRAPTFVVEHVQARVTDIVTAVDDGQVVFTDRGAQRFVDDVVLATGYGAAPGDALFASVESPLVVRDPYAPEVFERLGSTGKIVVVGTGLTAVDAILTLVNQRPCQQIVAVSRRGLLPSVHDLDVAAADVHLVSRTARGLLRELRRAVVDTEASGGDWRSVVDGVRAEAPELWRSLPVAERRRFLRLGRRQWELHRHRLAPSVADALADLVGSGHVEIRSAAPIEVSASPAGIEVTLRQRPPWPSVERVRAAGVVLCTGVINGAWTMASPLLGKLVDRGTVGADPVGLGALVGCDGRVLDIGGRHQDGLWAMGPLRRAAEWEATAIPEIRRQAAEMARGLWP